MRFKKFNKTLTKTSPDVVNVFYDMQKVELWWPNGHGEQKLYNLIVDLELDPGSSSAGGDKFHYNKTIGFRTVQLVQDEIGQKGDMCVAPFCSSEKTGLF